MQCKDIQSLIIEDIYDEITSDNKKLLRTHLEKCDKCSIEYKEIKDTSATLKLWKDEKPEALDLPQMRSEANKPRRVFLKIFAVAASILLLLSVTNFRFSINTNGVDFSFNLFGLSTGTDRVAANILENGSEVEQLQLMTELINAANDRQRQEIVTLLTDFYQVVEMRRQADLKVITQNIETIQTVSNQRIEETEQTMQDLIQFTGSVLDKGNYIKAIDTPK